ncbi:hypothetical protein MASR2M117_17420 [Paludibacter sp.]
MFTKMCESNEIDEQEARTFYSTVHNINQSTHRLIIQRLTYEMYGNRIYINPDITIEEVADLVGTNRTYVSKLINEYFKMNFCAFINRFRLKELIKIIKEDVNVSNKDLADLCGFGSTAAMKRTIQKHMNCSIKEFRNSLQRQIRLSE